MIIIIIILILILILILKLKKYYKSFDNKFVLFIPQCGINDCFVNIKRMIDYCYKYNRLLLLDMKNSIYDINLSDFFNVKNVKCNIIWDSNIIRNIILENNFSVYPNNLNYKLIDILDKKVKLKYGKAGYLVGNISLKLPNYITSENIILHSRCGPGNGYVFFKHLFLKNNIKKICQKKLSILKDNYLCIHVRNTDYESNYIELYQENINKIHSYDQIYLATDNKIVIDYFKSKNLNIFNFTTFSKNKSVNLHESDVSRITLLYNLFIDIFMATNSDMILSNSNGGFTQLLKDCHANKKFVLNKLK